jgi:hypothetical protein
MYCKMRKQQVLDDDDMREGRGIMRVKKSLEI